MKHLHEILHSGAQDFPHLRGSEIPFTLSKEKKIVTIVALGDVGSTLLLGLKILGSDVIEKIRIYDLNEKLSKRLSYEMNHLDYPYNFGTLPKVEYIYEENLFDCDIFMFCAAKSIPDIDTTVADVRMHQLKENRKIVEDYALRAVSHGFDGMFIVVSDPVEPLCGIARSSGLKSGQVQGFGLGVMASRAAFAASREERFHSFLTEGRLFGPHGGDLVVANSIINYDEGLSTELTRKTLKANMKVRGVGYKPYYAPAICSGAFSLLLMLRGEWYYSSVFYGSPQQGTYFGGRCRLTEKGIEVENPELPDALFDRVKDSYYRMLLSEGIS